MLDGLTRALRPERRRRPRIRRRAGSVHDLVGGPIRGEPLGAERLAESARALARGQRLRAVDGGTRRTPLLTRLTDTRWVLDETRDRLAGSADLGIDLEPAGEWLLDNYHVLDEHIAEVHASLPRGYYSELPELASGQLAGYPRVYEIATTLIGHTEGRIDRGNVELFIAAFQEEEPLGIGELWALPAMLRLGLIENLRRMALRMLQRLDETQAADGWAARLGARHGPRGDVPHDALAAFLAHHPPLTPMFVSRLVRQLR
ncbi:MAG TPA: hypothetical protein VEA99_08980, partial [Gemmatimonadaceae bacterium]|nr:hypothetical protein [Gemmatimonadaceae bacterium]